MSVLVTKLSLLLFVPLMVLLVWINDPVPPIDKATFSKIQKGMTKKEVENLLGPLAGSELQGELVGGKLNTIDVWEGRNCAIVVFFSDDRVTESFFFTLR